MPTARAIHRERIGKALQKAGVSETDYGYVLRRPSRAGPCFRHQETALALCGTGTAVSVAGFMLVPWLLGGQVVDMAEVMVAVGLLAFAGCLLYCANKGSFLDTEVDLERSELRIVRRNARGASQMVNRIAFDQVRSIFVQRNKMKGSSSLLQVRTRRDEEPLVLGRGSEEAMTTLHRRLVRDLHGRGGEVPEVRPTRVRAARAAALA